MRAGRNPDRGQAERHREGIVGRPEFDRVAEGRVRVGVVEIGGKPLVLVGEARLDALAQRAPGVDEITAAGDGAGHVENVVRRQCAVDACRPVERAWQQIRQLEGPARAKLDRARDDLLQRRIGHEEIVDHARTVGIGAAEFEWRRRAIGFGIIREEREIRRNPERRPGRRIEAAVTPPAVERCRDLVEQRDLREIVAAADRHGQLFGDIERILHIDAVVGVTRLDRDGLDAARRLHHAPAESGDAKIGLDHADFFVRAEMRPAAIEAEAERQPIGVTEYAIGIVDLRADAHGARARPGAVERAVLGAGQEIGDRGRRARIVAERRRAAGIEVGDIAVDMLLIE